MKTAMAFLSAIFILTVPVTAHSESVFVGKVPHVQRILNGDAILEFGHNEYPNRAWVSATLCEKYVPGDWAASDCRPYNQYKFRVAGLIYDGYSGEIRLGRRVCAWVEDGLLRPIARPTGQCGLNISTITNVYDDGFQKHWRLMDVITIQVQ
jgi:hypothetical protein